jgi:hypothetical protein
MEFLNTLITDENLRGQITAEFTKVLETERNEIGRLVNEGISKAGDSIIEKTLKPLIGIERLPEEKKFSDYVSRALPLKIENLKNEYETKIKELNEKVNSKVTDENLKNEFSKLHLTLQEKEKAIENLKSDYETKFQSLKIENAISNSMPALLSDEINKYKSIVRKNEFFTELKNDFDLKFNEKGELIAEDKKTFISKPFEQLAKEKLQDVLAGVEVKGFNPAKPTQISGDYNLPAGITLKEAAELAINHIKATKGSYNVLNNEHTEIYNKILSTFKK